MLKCRYLDESRTLEDFMYFNDHTTSLCILAVAFIDTMNSISNTDKTRRQGKIRGGHPELDSAESVFMSEHCAHLN